MVFQAHLTKAVESVDDVLKQIATQILQTRDVSNPSELIRAMIPFEHEVWKGLPSACHILQKWLDWVQVTHTHLTLVIPVSSETLLNTIWMNFLRRLSLDPWLVCASSSSSLNTRAKNNTSHGNRVLGLFVSVCQQTIFSLFSLPSTPFSSDSRREQPIRPSPDLRWEDTTENHHYQNEQNRYPIETKSRQPFEPVIRDETDKEVLKRQRRGRGLPVKLRRFKKQSRTKKKHRNPDKRKKSDSEPEFESEFESESE
jgi:hypothetical protein